MKSIIKCAYGPLVHQPWGLIGFEVIGFEVIGFGVRPQEVIDFSHFSSKYVIFSQKHTFQILDAHFPKRFRMEPHLNQKNLKKVSRHQSPKNIPHIHFLQKVSHTNVPY